MPFRSIQLLQPTTAQSSGLSASPCADRLCELAAPFPARQRAVSAVGNTCVFLFRRPAAVRRVNGVRSMASGSTVRHADEPGHVTEQGRRRLELFRVSPVIKLAASCPRGVAVQVTEVW